MKTPSAPADCSCRLLLRLLLPTAPAVCSCRLPTELTWPGTNRTADGRPFRAALYQLSYLAKWRLLEAFCWRPLRA